MSSLIKMPIFEVPDQTDLVFEVCKRYKSTMQREDKGTSRSPVFLDTSRTRNITFTSKSCIDKAGTIVATQYVPYMPTIFVNDYMDGHGEKKPGLRTLLGGEAGLEKEFRNALKNPIIFDKAGFLFLAKYDNDPMLVLFLMLHDYNEDALFRKGTLKTIPFLNFKQLKKEVKRTATMDSITSKMEVMKDIQSLYEKTNAGYKYDEIKIGALAKIFGINGQLPNVIDQYVNIVNIADSNPSHFKTTVDNAFNDIKIELAKAVQYKLITIGKNDAKIVRNGKPERICEVNENTALTDLCYYILGSKEGEKLQNEITDILQTAQIAGSKAVMA